jgi:small basic protein
MDKTKEHKVTPDKAIKGYLYGVLFAGFFFPIVAAMLLVILVNDGGLKTSLVAGSFVIAVIPKVVEEIFKVLRYHMRTRYNIDL